MRWLVQPPLFIAQPEPWLAERSLFIGDETWSLADERPSLLRPSRLIDDKPQ
jgi:hypothetical protein